MYYSNSLIESLFPFETTFIHLESLFLHCCWRVDLIYHLTTLICSTCQEILLHLELETTIITKKNLFLSLVVLGHHERRIALFHIDKGASSLFSPILEEFVFGEKVMIQSISRRYSFLWILFKESFQQIDPLIIQKLHAFGKF